MKSSIASINRNIVECKDIRQMPSICCPCIRINRNIVECKGISEYDGENPKGVLIETLWNVKDAVDWQLVAQLVVLIETLWNVKRYFRRSCLLCYQSINRNIVECKERLHRKQELLYLSVLIETLWNVKVEASCFAYCSDNAY